MTADQLKPGEHFKDMGGGWCVLSAEFISAMVSYGSKPAKPVKDAKK